VVLSGTPASSNTKTGPHDIAEILLKAALKQKIKKKLNLKQSEISLESKNPYIFTFNYQPK
jgi:hypothetical protein